MRRPHQPVARGAEAEEREAQERRPRQLEALPAVRGEEARRAAPPAPRPRRPLQSSLCERQLDPPLHRLERPLLALPHERRAEHRVALDRPLPGPREGGRVERPVERAAQLLDVDPRLRGVEAVEQDPLLQRGQRIDVGEVPRGHRLPKVFPDPEKRAGDVVCLDML